MKKYALPLFFSLFFSFSIQSQITDLPIEFDDISELDELNLSNLGVGYPWISNDGLRIYFVEQALNQQSSSILYAERSDLDDFFLNVQTLSIIDTDKFNYSPWLTEDELTIYYSTFESNGGSFNTLYKATRNSIDEDFGDPIKLDLTGTTFGFDISASFTSDGSQLYMYSSDGTENGILVYQRTSPDTYFQTGSLDLPTGFGASPCKLSPDGLSLYLSLTDGNDPNQLYVFKRDNLDEEFTDLFFLDNIQLNLPFLFNRHPSIGCDGNCIAFARANEDTFVANEIWLASREPTANQNIFQPAVEATIFPNPATDFINFEFEVPKKFNDLKLLIFNANGQLVSEKEISNKLETYQLDVRAFNTGNYFYQLKYEELLLVAGKVLVE